jgi:K+-sensing histidine kinase KdpD
VVFGSPGFARTAAVIAPVTVAAVLALLRDVMATAGAVLVLVLVMVAVAVVGDRVAGLLAVPVAVASFDFFLTRPYYGFAIFDRDDIEVAVLLAVIGIVMTEIVQWGRRQQARNARHEGYLRGLHTAARLAADAAEAADRITTIGELIVEVLDLDACRYDPAPDPAAGRPRMQHDGTVTQRGRLVAVERDGLPTMDAVELRAGPGDDAGCYLLVATSRVRRPDLEQRRVAVTLARQAALPARPRPTRPPRSGLIHGAGGNR